MRPLLLLDREIMMCMLELQGLIRSDAAVPNSYVSAIIRRVQPELEALRSACQDSDKSLRTLAHNLIQGVVKVVGRIDPYAMVLSEDEFKQCSRMMVQIGDACADYVKHTDATEPPYYPDVKKAIIRARDAISELYLKSDEPTRRTTHAVQTTLIAIGSALKFTSPKQFPFKNLTTVGKALADQFDTVEDVHQKSR
jgi:hypothetical protein